MAHASARALTPATRAVTDAAMFGALVCSTSGFKDSGSSALNWFIFGTGASQSVSGKSSSRRDTS